MIQRNSGFAVLGVLFVLLALLALCTPFLMTARNASRASSQLGDRVQGRLALDSAARHARARLGRSHPSVDETPYFDSIDEVRVDTRFDPAFLNANDPSGVMWDVDVEDVSARIDLGSAPPQVFANLFGTATRLAGALDQGAKELTVASPGGLDPVGFVWIENELIGYTQIDGRALKGLQRGLAHETDADGNPIGCGPGPDAAHATGAIVIGQKAYGPVMWRLLSGEGDVRAFESPEQVRDAGRQTLAGKLDPEELEALAQWCSPYGGVRAGALWQRPVRLEGDLLGGLGDCLLRVDETRWFNPGATVRIDDGRSTELGIVRAVEDGGVRLMERVRGVFRAYTAEVRVLAKRPVNVNVAPAQVLEALFLNLQLAGRNSRIVRGEARDLAALVIESRPFTGHEDFLRRVVLPAAGLEALPSDAPLAPDSLAAQGSRGSTGGPIIDTWDALALYRNALNANDSSLAFSTMPLCYTSRDVYGMELRASVNAPSGIERASGVRRQVELVVPQRELLSVFARQEDFDEALRLDREAPWWSSGPHATSRYDHGASPPSRMWAHFGTYEGEVYVPGITEPPAGSTPETSPVPEHVFASREEDGWAQPWAARVSDTSPRPRRHVMHFDHETRDPEGRYLPDETIVRPTDAKTLQWKDTSTELLRSISLGLWIKPRQLADGLFLDVGGSSIESDRITLGIEGPDLVLRVLDGAGDHPATALTEAGEVRFAVAPGDGPGLAQDTWSHVQIDVRGTRPDQMNMLVDGRDFGVRTPGLTRLVTAFNQGSTLMVVEDARGFPQRGVVRIGEELIEYRLAGNNTLDCSRSVTGEEHGFGGRLARETFDLQSTNGAEPGLNVALTKQINHAAGTPVQLYGYSLPLDSNVPLNQGVTSEVGSFAVGYVTAIQTAQSSSLGMGEPVFLLNIPFFQLGNGIEKNTQISAVELISETRTPEHTQELMNAFDPGGGYVAFMQAGVRSITATGGGGSTNSMLSLQEAQIFGVEIMRYSGIDRENMLLLNLQRAKLPGMMPGTAGMIDNGEAHAFVINWTATVNGMDPNRMLEWQLFVAPISIDIGAGGGGFLVHPDPEDPAATSEFAQITHTDDPELTEWVRYDRIVDGRYLVRSHPTGLAALSAAVASDIRGDFTGTPNPPPGGGAGGGGGGPSSAPMILPEPAASPPFAPRPAQQGSAAQGGVDWTHYMGEPDPSEKDKPVTRAARTAFQFRGVLGTYSHPHPSGTPVLPVFRCLRGDLNHGRPGRFDAAFLFDADATGPGWPVTVHRAVWPYQYTIAAWQPAGSDPMMPEEAGYAVGTYALYYEQRMFVALQEAAFPIAAGTVTGSTVAVAENRLVARLTLHPSGERPRRTDSAVLGGSRRGGGIPSALIDEVVFDAPDFDESTSQGSALQGASLVMGQDPSQPQATGLAEGALDFFVWPQAIRGAGGLYGENGKTFLSVLPPDAGLLRIGSEIVCYIQLDEVSGQVTLAPGGRGLLGTREESHEVGEAVTWLEHIPVSVLTGSIGGEDASLPLESTDEFPLRGGTVLVGTELMHYTRIRGNALEMPQASTEPGLMDGRGAGIFRGRFGTQNIDHGAGTPVILFPFRYWDRWADRADGPELSYFQFSLDQPNAFWKSMFWTAEETGSGGSRIAVLQRSDPSVPWDADPVLQPELELFERGMPQDGPNPIGVQRDRMEWRVFVRYAQGAFDELLGNSHAWKQAPRLRLFGVEFLGPSVILRRVDESQ